MLKHIVFLRMYFFIASNIVQPILFKKARQFDNNKEIQPEVTLLDATFRMNHFNVYFPQNELRFTV